MESASAGQFVVSKLGQLLVDEVQDIHGVGDKVVHHLMDELSTMNAVLRMISEADQSAVDHLVREWEKQVRELAYDAEDCADVYCLRVSHPGTSPQNHRWYEYVVKWPKYQLQKLMLQRTLAADVKALLERTIAVSERRVRYGIDRKTLRRSPWFAPVSAAAVSANALRRADDPDDQFVGIREQVDTLAERIKAVHAEDDTRLKVFSIVGFGGLGKTTLAVELCRRLDADFQRQALVSVSHVFDGEKDMKGLLARVLHQMVKVKEDGGKQIRVEEEATGRTHGNELKIDQMDVEEISSKLKELLMEKRYLIVIDDVWSVPAWQAIHIRLPENKCSSRVIVTTRIETVAKASSVSEDLVHHMKPLEIEDSKKLFVKRVFGSMGSTVGRDGLEDTMDKILKKCGGWPLAIVSIASLLASHNSAESVQMWIKVSNSIGSQMETHPTLEGMRQVITLSYDYLPHHLKGCMMYLSIFPEDYVIVKDRLLYRWVAEGLVAEKRGLTLFDVAEEYLNELIGRNLIQPDKQVVDEEGMVEMCRVHDMMLEVMVSKSQEANYVCLVGQQYGAGMPHGKVRRLSIHGNDDNNKHGSSPNSSSSSSNNNKKKGVERHRHGRHGGIEEMNLHHVRSLTTFQSEGLGKLLDRLGEFKLLRVLDLEDCSALENKHMRYVCQLYLLRFLSLRGTNINVMPSKIGDLEYLETLDVERTMIFDMPATMTKLSRLERLRVPQWILPQGLGNMKVLRDVSTARLRGGDIGQVAREIGELQKLQLLVLLIESDEEEEQLLHALASSLSKTFALRSLELLICDSNSSLEFLLHIHTPPPLLWRLVMVGPISRLPDWIASLKHLAEFSVYLAKLAGDLLLDPLCKLPSLQSIKLGFHSCRDQELVARTTHEFPALRILNLSHNSKYPEVVRFEEGSMIKLETLLLEFSDKETTIVGIDNLKNLKEVKLSGKKNNPSLEHALQQLKEKNENGLDKFSKIKVAVEYH